MFFSTVSPDRQLPTCATRDIAAVAARLLLDHAWSGQDTVAVLGPEDLSHDEMAGIMSDVLEQPVSYRHVPIDAFSQQLAELGMSEAMVNGMVEMMVAKDQGLDNAEPRTPESTTPTSFRQWCEEVLRPAVTGAANRGAARDGGLWFDVGVPERKDLPVGPKVTWAPVPRPGREPLPGAHVLLTPLVAADARALYAATHPPQGDISLWTYMSDGPYAGPADLRSALVAAEASEDPLFFAVLRDGRVLGRVSYMRIEPGFGVIEIGNIVFGPALQRTTAATEAIYLLARHAFDHLGYRRLEWKCNALNAASRRAADRFGFTFEGVFRNHQIVKGRNRDTAWYAIIDADWPAIRSGFEAWLSPDNFDGDGTQRAGLAQLITVARSD
jgi:RimJ/RimL family protein N-acetyltransferase